MELRKYNLYILNIQMCEKQHKHVQTHTHTIKHMSTLTHMHTH